jgi:hypothetical protein
MSAPTTVHMVAMIRLLGYLKATQDFELEFDFEGIWNLDLIVYPDASYKSGPYNRSVTGIYVTLRGVPINWICKKHSITTQESTRGAELVALNTAQIISQNLQFVLHELEVRLRTGKSLILEDNRPFVERLRDHHDYNSGQCFNQIFVDVKESLKRGSIDVEHVTTDK